MGLHRLLGMRIGVPAPDALASFYGELGLSEPSAGTYAGTDTGPLVSVEEYPFRRLLEVSIGADSDRTVDEIAARMSDLGATTSRGADGELSAVDPHSQVTFRVRVADPLGVQTPPARITDNAPGHAVRRNARANGVFGTPRPPRRLGHIVIGTPDLAATRDLLIGLGCKLSDEMPGIIAFLRCSTDHHNIGLVGSPVPMLQHYSWECDDVDHVGHAATALLRADPDRQAWGFGRHFVGSNYYWYLRDPAGSFLELFSDMDVIDDDDAWEREGRTPFGFEHVANSWGPAVPMEFIAPTDLPVLQAAWAARS